MNTPDEPATEGGAAVSRRHSYLMLLVAFVVRNLATGMTFSAFALLFKPLSEEFGGDTVLLSATLGAIAVGSGLSSPLAGALVDRWSLRGTVLIGCLVFASGFTLAARADSAALFLLGFGVLGGIGLAMAGMLVANRLATLYFPQTAGLACAVANLPVAAVVLPPVLATVIASLGWRAMLQGFAVIYLLMFVLFALLLPAAQAPPRHPAARTEAATPTPPPFKTAVFWVIGIAIGLILTNNLVLSTHIVNHAVMQGVPYTQASLLISLLGLSSIIGTLGFGWLCDRTTPFLALAIAALLMATLWFALTVPLNFARLALVIAVMGTCTSAVVPAMGAIVHRLFPAAQFGTASGQLGLAVLPFLVFAAPLASLLFAADGHYRTAFALQAGLCGLAFALLWLGHRRWPLQLVARDPSGHRPNS